MFQKKYGNKKTQIDGYYFASKLEADLYVHLKEREKLGEIRDIKCQVQVRLTDAKILYKPDFSAIEVDSGQVVYFEAKGFETDVWRIKRRLWEAGYGPGRLEVWKRRGRDGIKLAEVLEAFGEGINNEDERSAKRFNKPQL